MRAQRVLILTGSLCIGGAERQSVVLANGLHEAGLDVHFGYFEPIHQLREFLHHAVCKKTFCLEKHRRFDLRAFFRLRRQVLQLQPDVVVCVNLYPLLLLYVTRLSMLHSRPVLMPVMHSTILEGGVMRLMARWVLGHVIGQPWARTVFLSRAQLEFWSHHYGVDTASAKVIYNGVDPRFFVPQPTSQPGEQHVLAICAGLRPVKRHLDLLKAAAQLVDEGYDLRVLLIGDGPERDRIEAWCREHRFADRCEIAGFQADVRPWLARSDICLLTSASETFPMSLLEAMSMAKPVLGPAVGGIPEQVADGVNGLLFELGNLESLIDKLRQMLVASRQQREIMGQAGRQRVLEYFSEDRMLMSYLTELQSIGIQV